MCSEEPPSRSLFITIYICLILFMIIIILFWIFSVIYVMVIIVNYDLFDKNLSEHNCTFIKSLNDCPNLNIVAKLDNILININDFYYNIDNCNYNLYLYKNSISFTCLKVEYNEYDIDYYTINSLKNYNNNFKIQLWIFPIIAIIGGIIFLTFALKTECFGLCNEK